MSTRVTKEGHIYEEPEVNFRQIWHVEVGFDMSDVYWMHNDNTALRAGPDEDPGDVHARLYEETVRLNRSIVAGLIEEAIIDEYGLPLVKVAISLTGEIHGRKGTP